MKYAEHIADLVGNTPLVKLSSVTRDPEGIACTVLAKIEYFNPGGSVKDRIALRMVEAAEQSGELKPGGTIVEPTSGNTGVGLALVAQQRGYDCVFVCPDKVSQDKQDVLRAYGARGGRLPDRRRARAPRLVLLRLRPPGPRDRRRVEAEPVRQPDGPAEPLRDDRSRDLVRHRRAGHPLRHRHRHRRHDQRHRAVPQGGLRRAVSASSAPTRRARSTPAAPAGPTSSRGSARTSGPPPTTRRSSTRSSPSPTPTRSR